MPAPRLRIAPSPTGLFHVGTARSALFNWLEARRTGGQFLLRIEDTDTEREVPGAVDGIYRSLEWLGLDWDEEPVFQSHNRERHIAAALKLAEEGVAYWSDPMPLAPDGKPLQYDGRDRERDLPRADGRALRFKTPREGEELVHDLVRGDPVFAYETIEDFGLLRGNGEPLFLLGNVIDDLDQRISHVVRGEDHLPNTPKYQLIWRAVAPDVPLPTFAHLPLLVNDKRKKLSKRRDKVALEAFRDDGYLPEVMANFLCLLGWSPPDGRERFRIGEVVREFSLADVISSPAFFDQKKLDAFNADTIRELSVDELADRADPFFARHDMDLAVAKPLLPDVLTRVVTLAEVPAMVDFLYDAPSDLPDARVPWVPADWDKAVRQAGDACGALLDAVVDGWTSCDWDAAAVRAVVESTGEGLGLNLKKAQAPVRVAITGRSVGPPLFESVVTLGRDEAVARVRSARARRDT
jgi:glutamyl-tRNA synthetase